MTRLPERTEKMIKPVWRAGIYARLSVDSNSRKNESIDTQLEIAEEFINGAEDIELVCFYSDM